MYGNSKLFSEFCFQIDFLSHICVTQPEVQLPSWKPEMRNGRGGNSGGALCTVADKTKRRKVVSIKYKLSTHICLSEYYKLQLNRSITRKGPWKYLSENTKQVISTSGLAKYKSEKRVSSKIQISRARIGLGRSQIENRQRPRVLLVRESGFTQELSIFFSLFYIFFSLYHILLLFISHCLQKVSRQYN